MTERRPPDIQIVKPDSPLDENGRVQVRDLMDQLKRNLRLHPSFIEAAYDGIFDHTDSTDISNIYFPIGNTIYIITQASIELTDRNRTGEKIDIRWRNHKDAYEERIYLHTVYSNSQKNPTHATILHSIEDIKGGKNLDLNNEVAFQKVEELLEIFHPIPKNTKD